MGYPKRLIDRAALFGWDLLWLLCLPLVLLYLWNRSRKEPLYFQHLSERFGLGPAVPAGAIWVHAVSLGEMRAARPLIDALLHRGEQILITNITAAGRAETNALFADAIAAGQLHVRWCPAEYVWVTRRFFKRYQPKFGMIMEIELWPRLIASANYAGVPMVLAQAQYPDKSFARDQRGLKLRAQLVHGFTLILAKSEHHAERFRHFGATNVQVMGELRFEQPIPSAHLKAAAKLRAMINPARPIFCLASTGPDEDPLLIPVVTRLRAAAVDSGRPLPFFVYVPRHPKNFDDTSKLLQNNGLKMLQRSNDLDADLHLSGPLAEDLDGLFGDSLGEINFYFGLADHVFIGDSFNNEGSHNIIEPLSVGKPVVVGPSIWGIEYPAIEAIEAGVLTKVQTPDELLEYWNTLTITDENPMIRTFLDQHGGATAKAVEHLRSAGLLS